jgi:uncharacterized membrane protein YuzA (DUF378 family)
MENLLNILILWAIIGFFICGFVPKVTGKKSALKQTFWLGPIFWIAIGICGSVVFIRKKLKGY